MTGTKFITGGDIFLSKAEAIVNPVNCVGVSGAGLALEFKKRYPHNEDKYVVACNSGKLLPGIVLVTDTNNNDNPKHIINFPTKVHWKNASKIEYIIAGLNAVINVVMVKKLKSIAIPALGCGRGGLSWNEVKLLIFTKMSLLSGVLVEVYEPDERTHHV